MLEITFNKKELADVVRQAVAEALSQTTPTPEPKSRILHSIRELADFIGCSIVTAQRYKNEKRIPFRQIGRKVLFDTEEVLKAMNQRKG